MTMPTPPAPFRLGVAEGIVPRKWVRDWEQRFPETPLVIVPLPAAGGAGVVRSRRVDAAILRLRGESESGVGGSGLGESSPGGSNPGESGAAGLHVIPLFEEVPVVVAPREHYLAAAEDVAVTDFADETLQQPRDAVNWAKLVVNQREVAPPIDPPANTASAVELVAAGVGLLVVPMSLARLHHRKDLTYVPVTDLEPVGVGLAWLADNPDLRIEEFIGILRGRTAASTRGRAPEPAQKRTAREKARARREFLAAQRGESRSRGGTGRGKRRGPGKGR